MVSALNPHDDVPAWPSRVAGGEKKHRITLGRTKAYWRNEARFLATSFVAGRLVPPAASVLSSAECGDKYTSPIDKLLLAEAMWDGCNYQHSSHAQIPRHLVSSHPLCIACLAVSHCVRCAAQSTT